MAIASISNGESGSSVRTKLNALIALEPAEAGGQANATGITISANSGEAVSAGDVGYLKSDGKIWKTDASAEATANGLIGIVTTTVAGADLATGLQISGNYTDSGLTTGSIYYLSETAGAKTTTAPTTNAAIVRVLGYATSTTNFVVSPDETWVENGADEVTVNAQTGTTYTLVIGDASAVVTMNNASANVLTVPLNASVAFPTGTTLDVIQIGAGLTTIRGASGVTLNGTAEAGGNESDVASQGQYKGLSLVKIATDSWLVVGGA